MKGKSLVEHDDGWTTVKKGPSGQKRPPPSTQATIKETDPSQLKLQVDKLSKRYARFRELFRRSRYWYQLQQTLDLQPQCHIESAVCLGLGALASEQSTLADRSLWQLTLFQEVTDYWQRRNPSKPVDRFAQEIAATDIDRLFLETLDVTLVEHPLGIEKITETSFLYDPFLPWAVMLCDVLPRVSPAFYLGSAIVGIADMCEDPAGASTMLRLEGCERSNEDIKSAIPVARAFLEHRTRLGTPAEFEHHSNVFLGMVMLVKKRGMPDS